MKEKLTHRTETRQVWCGNVPVGGGAPVPIQAMTNTFTEDAEATAAQVLALAEAGADIVRVAVPTNEAARNIPEIKIRIAEAGRAVPVVADIHFDYQIALAAIKAGADKIRINPGNIGGEERLKAVADAAGAAGIPIRIGVNSGSLEKKLQEYYMTNPAKALAVSALMNIESIKKTGFEDIVVSVKASDVQLNTETHKLLASATDHPLHIGITEAGAGEAGIVKSAAGIGALLSMGIGDTIRVSLTGDPLNEIPVARSILRSFSLLPGQITFIACPTCGRCRQGLEELYTEISAAISQIENKRVQLAKAGIDIKPLTIALMGCAVNGPGEASHADFGVALGASGGLYFEKGLQIGPVAYDEIAKKIIDNVIQLTSESLNQTQGL